jgi:hypothetical protein
MDNHHCDWHSSQSLGDRTLVQFQQQQDVPELSQQLFALRLTSLELALRQHRK